MSPMYVYDTSPKRRSCDCVFRAMYSSLKDIPFEVTEKYMFVDQRLWWRIVYSFYDFFLWDMEDINMIAFSNNKWVTEGFHTPYTVISWSRYRTNIKEWHMLGLGSSLACVLVLGRRWFGVVKSIAALDS